MIKMCLERQRIKSSQLTKTQPFLKKNRLRVLPPNISIVSDGLSIANIKLGGWEIKQI